MRIRALRSPIIPHVRRSIASSPSTQGKEERCLQARVLASGAETGTRSFDRTASHFMQCCTVHSQGSGVAGCSGCVGGCASVFPSVSRAHGLDSHHADALAVSRDRHVPVILLGDRFAVQRPRHLDRQVSLQDRADCRDRLAPIRRLVADRERRDLRSD
jgi:hypothetical protein